MCVNINIHELKISFLKVSFEIKIFSIVLKIILYVR
jgi:hypothetical protein